MAAEAVAAPELEPDAPTEVQPPAEKPKAKKADKEKKGKKVKDEKASAAPEGAPSIVAHPRAVRSIARAKSWGGLLGFFLTGYLSSPTSTLAEAGLRALVAGAFCYVAVWAAAVFVWRKLVILEIKAREQQLVEQIKKAAGAGAPGGRAGARDAQ